MKTYGNVSIITLADQKQEQPMYTLTERTYVNGDRSAVVPESSPEAAFLLGNAGMKIDNAEARRLGLLADDADEEPAAEAKQVPNAPEDKAVHGPAESKAGSGVTVVKKEG